MSIAGAELKGVAGRLDLTIEQGATFNKVITLTLGSLDGDVLDLSGTTGAMQIRQTVDDAGTLADLTTENGGLIITGLAGTIEIVITAAQTAALTFTDPAVYDLEVTYPDLTVRRIIQGTVTLDLATTR